MTRSRTERVVEREVVIRETTRTIVEDSRDEPVWGNYDSRQSSDPVEPDLTAQILPLRPQLPKVSREPGNRDE